jgi:hypothetical protein
MTVTSRRAISAARGRHHVDHLGQVDDHEVPAVHQEVVRREVPVREPLVGQQAQHVQQLVPEPCEVRGFGPELGKPGRGRAVRLVEVLH